MPETEDLYEILQVHPSAHPDVIQAAYRRLTLLYHPDRNPSLEAAEMMTRLNLAYETLNDPDRRMVYDRTQVTQQAQRTETRSRDTHSGRPRQGNPARGPASQSRATTQTTPPKAGFTKAHKITVGAIGLAVVVAIAMSAIFSADRPGNGDDGTSRSVVVLPTETPIPPTITSVPASRSKRGLMPIAALAAKPTPTSLPSPTAAPIITPQPARVGYFAVGSSQDEVSRIQGPPSGIRTYSALGLEDWYYSSSRVTFSLPDRRVKEWVNKGNLKVRRGETSMPALVSPARATPTATLSPKPTPLPSFRPTPMPTHTSTPVPTYTPSPTYTPLPTYTPMPLPTATPYPTATAYPTATPAPKPIPLLSPTVVPSTSAPVIGGGYFTRGSSQDDVLRVQGTPDEIKVYTASKEEVWYYGNPVYVRSTVTFSIPDRRVIEWNNGDGSLKSRLLPKAGQSATPGYFTRGSSQDDVLHVQGTPDEIKVYSASREEVWYYGNPVYVRSTVTFSLHDGRVKEWANGDGSLKAQLLPKTGQSATPGYFTRSSSQDDVLHVQGTPDEVKVYSASREEVWYYGDAVYVRSTVTFSLPDRRVKEWNNGDGSLKFRPEPSDSSLELPATLTPSPLPTVAPTTIPTVVVGDYFTRGSSQDDVLHVQGTPTGIETYLGLGEEIWSYGYSLVTFSLPEKRVTEWSNLENNLKVRLLPMTGNSRTLGYFTRGSSQDDVLHVQGTPTGIETYLGLGEEIWSYGYSLVTFSLPEKRVTEWSNLENNLKVRLLPMTGHSQTPGYFTRGSSQDDVLHVQGTPTGIETYLGLGEEIWSYGYSLVTFSLPEKQVTEWNNEGNLKVR